MLAFSESIVVERLRRFFGWNSWQWQREVRYIVLMLELRSYKMKNFP